MRCDEFIQSYSDYRDGLLGDVATRRAERHLAKCRRCARYHRVLERGVELWCRLPGAKPSPDFLPRLQHRLYHIDDATRLTSKRALGSAALVAVAAVGFLAVTWLPFATRMTVEIELPPVAVQPPASSLTDGQPGLFDDGPYVGRSARFMVPLQPTLDGSSDLFTAYWLTIPPIRYDPAPRPLAQLDDSR